MTLAANQPARLAPPPIKEVKETRGDRNLSYLRLDDGEFNTASEDSQSSSHRLMDAYRSVRDRLVPKNFPDSVTPDYAPSRVWAFLHDNLTNVANFAAGAAMAGALGASPVWGGMAMAFFNMYKDQIVQLVGLGFAQLVPMSERKPRPWMLAGEVVEKVGTAITTLTALLPSGPGLAAAALLGMAVGTGLIGSFAGSMKGGASAEIGPRQAKDGNLGDVGAKNGCQWIVGNLLVSTPIILLLEKYLPPLMGGSMTNLAMALGGSLAAIWCQGRFVKALNYHPINEQTVRELVLHPQAPPVDTKVWGSVKTIFEHEKIKVGQSVKPLLANGERFDHLRSMYRDRNYMMEWSDGKPTIVLREKRLEDGDRPTPQDQFLAVMQAANAEVLAASQEYSVIKDQKGQTEADRWVTARSLEVTPTDIKPILDSLAQAGWSTDAFRFNDSGYRGSW